MMKKFLLGFLAFATAPALAQSDQKPIVLKNGQMQQIQAGDRVQVPTLKIDTGAASIQNNNGENISLFHVFDAYGWEKRDGTRDNPITIGGPSLKVSRVENLPLSQCSGIFNENSCNSAIYGSASHSYNSAVFTGSISGTTLTVTAIQPGSRIELGGTITGSGISANTTVSAYVTGSGGLGTYTVNNSQTVASTTMTMPNYNPMQLTGVLGTSLIYSAHPGGEGVGVQGISRAVGASKAGIAGGYFESRYDSFAPRDYYFTVGIESRSNNLTGNDAPIQNSGGNNYIPVLATCGGGSMGGNFTGSISGTTLTVTAAASNNIYPGLIVSGVGVTSTRILANGTGTGGTGTYIIETSQTVGSGAMNARQPRCGSFFVANAEQAQAYYGYLAATGSASDAAFYDASSATDSIRIDTGSHTNLINANSYGFNVSGSGKVWVGSNYNSSTTYGVTVRQANGTQALFQSTGTNGSVVTIENTTAGQQARLDFNEAGANKWQIGKLSNNDFFIWDNAASATALIIPSNGSTVDFGKGLRFMVTTVGALPTCNATLNGAAYYVTDASAPTYNATLAGGGAVRTLAICNGTNWTAH